MKSTGGKDSKPADAATDYVPSDDDTSPTDGPAPDRKYNLAENHRT